MNPEHDELDPRLARALSRLAGELAPPPALEDRVVATLRRRGAIVAPRRPALRFAIAGAAVLVVGFLAGRWSAVERAVESGHFLLFLLDDVSFGDLDQERRYYDESAAWTEKLERDGHLLSASRLASARTSLLCGDPTVSFAATGSGFSPRGAPVSAQRAVLSQNGAVTGSSPGGPEEGMLGFFLIRARDEQEATAVARGSPHLLYGGKIEIWRLVGRP